MTSFPNRQILGPVEFKLLHLRVVDATKLDILASEGTFVERVDRFGVD